jgi:DNA-binding transcriptional regulator YdaS (Cro superfamily)
MLRHLLRRLHTEMDLKAYTEKLPHGGTTALAERLGISRVYLSQLSARQRGREPSPELCVQIEIATEHAVHRWDLRPDDWHRIWPELIAADGAPVVTPVASPDLPRVAA